MEEETSTGCQYSPGGAAIIDTLVHTYTNILPVSHHIVYYTPKDSMAIPESLTYIQSSKFGTPSFPASSFNRILDTPASYTLTSVPYILNKWHNAIGFRQTDTSHFDVSMSHLYNKTSRVINVTVAGKALMNVTGNYKLAVFITEDSINQYSQLSAYNAVTTSPYFMMGNPIPFFNHMYVLRSVLGTINGTTCTGLSGGIVANAADSMSFNYTLPANFNDEHIRLTGIIFKEATGEVMNSVRAKLTEGYAAKIYNITNEYDRIIIYPNPANKAVNIKLTKTITASLNIIITDITGRKIISKEYPAGNTTEVTLNTEQLNQGKYLINIVTGREVSVKMLEVIR